MLSLQRHLLRSKAHTREIRFTWDDWDREAVEERPDESFVKALARISDRAVVAMAAATGEWIAYRFKQLDTDPKPWQLLEATWAAGVDWRYASATWESVTVDEDWTGPVKGVLEAAMMATDDIVNAVRGGEDLSDGARWLSNLAAHVLPDPGPFREWRAGTLERLTSLYPRDENDPIGDVVPRETFDLAREFLLEETEHLVSRFLASLDWRANPFLASPDELVEAGLPGRPYTFDLARDRQERLAWS